MSRPLKVALPATLLLGLSVDCAPAAPVSDELYAFETCDELQLFLEDRMLHPRVASRATTGSGFLIGCAQRSGGAEPNADALAVQDGESTRTRDTDAPLAAGGADDREFTSTNTQEVNVDEADFVKNDGDHIYVLRRGHLLVLNAWPPESASLVSDTDLGGHPFTMFLDGDRAMVVSSENDIDEGSLTGEFTGALSMLLIDLTDKSAPDVIRRVDIDGDYVSARRVNDDVIVVSRSRLTWPSLRSGVFHDDENRERLRETPITDAFPTMTDERIGIDVNPRPRAAVDCRHTYAADDTQATDILLVHTISVRNPDAPIKSTSVVTSWSNLYASEKSIYLAASEMRDGGYFTPPFVMTRMHKLRAFQGAGAAEYVGSGTFEGEIKDQFSMSENGDQLRVVTTSNTSASGDESKTTTSVLVLEEGDGGLTEIGRVDNIGNGEFVQSVRFIGDFAYVVTYPEEWFFGQFPPAPVEEIRDPLFVIDLTEPRAPRVRGELKVEGFSTYIHPLGPDHLLTVGVNTTLENVFQGLTLSIFDVSDKDQPTLAHIARFGDETSSSDALANHHAFTLFASRGLLAIPHQRTENGVLTSSALEVFKVDADSGFAHLGTLEQLPLISTEDRSASACLAVKRSVMIADEDDAYVFAISTAGMSVARIDQALTDVAAVEYGAGTGCATGFSL